MKPTFVWFILACFLIPSCNSVTPTSPTEQLTVGYSAATTPWLVNLYDCAGANVIHAEQTAADFIDLQSVDMAIRIGQSAYLTSHPFQIGSDELLVIVNPRNLIHTLTVEQVHGIFTGQILNWQELDGSNSPVQVWVYSSGEDVEQIFEQSTLGGSPVASTARLAVGPDEMTQAIAGDVNAVGILTRSWKTGNVSDVYNIGTIPVLALTMDAPQGEVKNIISCLQK